MAHYYVVNEAKTYGRVIDAPSSFEARRIVARANNADITNFFARRHDLVDGTFWTMWQRIKNK